ncbi:MAG: hypothetical protein QOF85_872 [Solirubrobacterales bacterium]|nr:hypothetical protein [Solirubrobacterales bacterium]
MARSRLGLKALGLCALVFGLIVVAAGTVQAEATSKWVLVKPSIELLTVGVPNDTLLPEVQISEIEELKDEKDPGKHLVLLTKSGTNTITLLCSAAELENAAGTGPPKLLLEGSILGRAKFTGCIFKINGTTQSVCKPHSKGSAEGTILTERVKGLIVLHELAGGIKDATVLLQPEDKEGKTITTFVTVILGVEGASECAVGELLSVGGELILADGQGTFTTEQATHLIEEFKGLQKLWAFKSDNPASIDGSVVVELVGEHKGLNWAGIPG